MIKFVNVTSYQIFVAFPYYQLLSAHVLYWSCRLLGCRLYAMLNCHSKLSVDNFLYLVMSWVVWPCIV